MKEILRKTLLYKTGVEYGDFTINHAEGCAHGCKYPCYAFLMAKRFGKVKNYQEWIEPKIVGNALELLDKELSRYRARIKSVHLCFSTDPFMYDFREIKDLSLQIIDRLNKNSIKCTVLTKGILPLELAELSPENEYGITLVTLDEKYRQKYEPYAAPISERLEALYRLYLKGKKTWISIEPYPTPNIMEQDFETILKAVTFADKIIFGRLNYNSEVSKYPRYKSFFNQLSERCVDFCRAHGKEYHIKQGTVSEEKEPVYSCA